MLIRRPAAFNLIGLRTIRWQDMRLFLICIFLISVLYTVTGSIFLGVSRVEVFVSETENTLVIKEPNQEILFSKVPVYIAEDLLRLEGVTAVSPETVDLLYDADHDQAVFARGVTNEFPKVIDKFSLVSGRWFNFSTGIIEGVVGLRYAEQEGIHTGENVFLVSRRTDLVFSVQIVGILQTKTNVDDGFLLPLWTGQLLSDYSQAQVNLIRVKYDSEASSRHQIQETVNGKFSVIVEVQQFNSTSFDPQGTQIAVYDRNQELIATQTIEGEDAALVNLPFGTYTFVATTPFFQKSKPVQVFIDKDGVLNLLVGTPSYTMDIETTYNLVPTEGILVSISTIDGNIVGINATDSQGKTSFNFPEGPYTVTAQYLGVQNSTRINLLAPIALKLAICVAVDVQISNVTSLEPIAGISMVLTTENGDILDSNVSTGTKGAIRLYGAPGKVFLNSSLGNISRVDSLTLKGYLTLSVAFGYVKVTTTVERYGLGPITNATLTVSRMGRIVANGTTNSAGKINTTLVVGNWYNFSAETTDLGSTGIRSLRILQETAFTLNLDPQPALLLVLNTTTGYPISNATVEAFDSKGIPRGITITNKTGHTTLLLEYGLYRIVVTSAKQLSMSALNHTSEPATNLTTLFLGNVTLTLRLFGHDNNPTEAQVELHLLPQITGFTKAFQGGERELSIFPGTYHIVTINDSESYYLQGNWTFSNDSEVVLNFTREELRLTLLSPANNSVVLGGSELQFSIGGYNETLIYSWDQQANQTSSSKTVPVFADSGSHFLYVMIFNRFGDYQAKKYQFDVNNPPMNITLLNPSNDSSAPGGTTVQLSLQGSNGSFIYNWDNTINKTEPVYDYSLRLSRNGAHTLQIWLSNFVGGWLTAKFIFHTTIYPLNMTLETPENASFVSPSSFVSFVVENANETIFYRWNNALANSSTTLDEDRLILSIPNNTGVHHLHVYSADWDGNWNTLYLEFIAVWFLNIRVLNISTGVVLSNSQVTISNSNYLLGPISTENLTGQGIPLMEDIYTIKIEMGQLIALEVLQLTSNASIGFNVAQLIVHAYNNTSSNALRSGTIKATSSKGEIQQKSITGDITRFWLLADAYNITIEVADNTAQRQLVLADDTQISFFLGPYLIQALCVSGSGSEGLAGVQVQILEEGFLLAQELTDSTGIAHFPLWPGNYSLEAAYEGIISDEQITVTESQLFKVTLPVYAALVVSVGDQGGVPIAGARVILEGPGNFWQQNFTTVDGTTAFDQAPLGTYLIQAHYNGHKAEDTIEVISGQAILAFLRMEREDSAYREEFPSGKWSGGRSYEVKDAKASINLQQEFFLSVFVTGIAIIGLITILSIMAISATVAHLLLESRHDISHMEALGASDAQIKFSLIFQLLQPTLITAAVASFGANLTITLLPVFQVISVGGFMVIPVSNPILPLSMTFLMGIIVAGSIPMQIYSTGKVTRETIRVDN
ncbi:MAG: ABC transporter permease [Candidatus Heimdallarchaeota archaeon]